MHGHTLRVATGDDLPQDQTTLLSSLATHKLEGDTSEVPCIITAQRAAHIFRSTSDFVRVFIMIKLTSLCLFAALTISSSIRSTADDAGLPSDPSWNWDEVYDEHKSKGADWNDWYARRYGEQPWWWGVSSDDSDGGTARQSLKSSLPSLPGSRPPAPKGFEIPPLSDIAASYRDHGFAFSSARQMEHEPRMSRQVAQRSVSGLARLGYARQEMLRSTAQKQAKHLPKQR